MHVLYNYTLVILDKVCYNSRYLLLSYKHDQSTDKLKECTYYEKILKGR